jgi:hypothetical protein
MKTTIPSLLCVVLGFLFVSSPLSAHHGKGAFEMDKLTVVKGTVTKF